MNKETPEQEAERLYPLPSGAAGLESDYTLSDVRVMQQQAHITAARMYMGEVERLKEEIAATKNFDATEQYHKLVAENETMRKVLEAEGYCTMCHEKKKKHALLVCDTCYNSFDGDRRSFWDDDFIH